MVVLVITLVTLIPVAVLLESCHIGSLTWAWWLKHVETTAAEQVHLPAMRPKGFFKPRMVLWLVSREYFQGWRELFSVLSTASTPLCVSQAMRRQRAEALERQNRLGDRLDQMQMHHWMPETAASLERHASAKRNSVEVGVNKKTEESTSGQNQTYHIQVYNFEPWTNRLANVMHQPMQRNVQWPDSEIHIPVQFRVF